MSSLSSLKNVASPLRIFTIWTRRGVNEVVGSRLVEGNTCIHGDNVQSTNMAVQISNSSQSLKPSVQMAQSLSQALSFQACHSAQNGLTVTQTLCKYPLNQFCYMFANHASVLQCRKMAGPTTSLVQSGSRNHLYHRLLHKTLLENQFSLSLMVMAHMKLLRSFALPRQI